MELLSNELGLSYHPTFYSTQCFQTVKIVNDVMSIFEKWAVGRRKFNS